MSTPAERGLAVNDLFQTDNNEDLLIFKNVYIFQELKKTQMFIFSTYGFLGDLIKSTHLQCVISV